MEPNLESEKISFLLEYVPLSQVLQTAQIPGVDKNVLVASSEQQPSTSNDESNSFKRYFRSPSALKIEHVRKLMEMKLCMHDIYNIYIVDHNLRYVLDDEMTLKEIVYLYDWKHDSPLPLYFTLVRMDNGDEDRPPVLDVEEMPNLTASKNEAKGADEEGSKPIADNNKDGGTTNKGQRRQQQFANASSIGPGVQSAASTAAVVQVPPPSSVHLPPNSFDHGSFFGEPSPCSTDTTTKTITTFASHPPIMMTATLQSSTTSSSSLPLTTTAMAMSDTNTNSPVRKRRKTIGSPSKKLKIDSSQQQQQAVESASTKMHHHNKQTQQQNSLTIASHPTPKIPAIAPKKKPQKETPPITQMITIPATNEKDPYLHQKNPTSTCPTTSTQNWSTSPLFPQIPPPPQQINILPQQNHQQQPPGLVGPIGAISASVPKGIQQQIVAGHFPPSPLLIPAMFNPASFFNMLSHQNNLSFDNLTNFAAMAAIVSQQQQQQHAVHSQPSGIFNHSGQSNLKNNVPQIRKGGG